MMQSFNKFSKARGFTLIELLVVIAIIGILAGIVLAALGNVRQQGADAGVSGNLDGMRTQGEVYAQGNGQSYSGYCSSANAQNALKAAATDIGGSVQAVNSAAGVSGKVTCNDSASAWAANSSLKTNTAYFWCVDSNGFSGTTTVSSISSGTDTICS